MGREVLDFDAGVVGSEADGFEAGVSAHEVVDVEIDFMGFHGWDQLLIKYRHE